MRHSFIRSWCALAILGFEASSLSTAFAQSFPPIAPIFPPPLEILLEPQSRTVRAGDSVIFSVVTAGGGTLTYQWQVNGTNIVGAVDSSYVIPNAQTNDTGEYTVTISSSQSAAASLPARLTVMPALSAPVILVQPRSQAVPVGSRVIFTVVATASTPLSYQWQHGGVLISGATQASLILASAQPADIGSYSVVVTTGTESIVSAPANLTILVAAPTSPLLSMPQLRAQRLRFNVQVDPNRSYRIQTSTDLDTWVDIGSFFSIDSQVFIEQSFSPDVPAQFYRIVAP
jgi:hypothetical protein